MGIKDARALLGGYNEWVKEGNTVATGEEAK
jgi:3-mercaptopyruvate sulfurtransferase SseA